MQAEGRAPANQILHLLDSEQQRIFRLQKELNTEHEGPPCGMAGRSCGPQAWLKEKGEFSFTPSTVSSLSLPGCQAGPSLWLCRLTSFSPTWGLECCSCPHGILHCTPLAPEASVITVQPMVPKHSGALSSLANAFSSN